MNHPKILAIDPGKQGGIVWRAIDGQLISTKMPDTEGDILDILQNAFPLLADTVVIEQVGGFIGKGQPGSAMFNFGRNYGFLIGVAMAIGYRVELVTPKKWQKPYGLGTVAQAGGSTAWKNKLKGLAQRLYPQNKITNSTADAFLIYDWAINHRKEQ